jgi:hypothetical protein
MAHYRRFAIFPILALAWAAPGHAQALDDKFWFQASGYFANVDTDIRVSSNTSTTPGTEIDLESDLGFDDDEFLPSFLAGARIGSGFSLIGEYYSLSRDSSVMLERDIVVEDVTYPASAMIDSSFETDIYRFSVGWAFARGDNYEVGASIGLHATDIAVALEGQASVGGGAVQVQQRRQDFLAPLPTLGLFATFEPMPKVTIGARVDYLSLGIDDYDGRLLNAQASVSYRVWRNVGIGAMYRLVDYRVDVEKERYTGRFDYEYNGPAIFLEVGF